MEKIKVMSVFGTRPEAIKMAPLVKELAQREGYECIGCTMKLYTNTDAGISERHTCCSLDDVEDARAVAYRLGMRYCVFNFSEGFREQVMLPFCEAYRCARTPNPCIECNRRMKFDTLFRRAEELGCEKIVTGHYARIARAGERYFLQKALDETKDQSYVLYAMPQRELAHTLFPLGAMRKSETRAIAETQGFGNARKRDSQDICFAPDGDYAAAIGRLTGEKSVPGAFVSTDGRVLGEEKDLYRSETAVSDVNWISGDTPEVPVRCAVKIRYRAREQAATVYPEENGCARIVFDAPQRAVTPGQAAVFYDGDTVLGGGTIE